MTSSLALSKRIEKLRGELSGMLPAHQASYAQDRSSMHTQNYTMRDGSPPSSYNCLRKAKELANQMAR